MLTSVFLCAALSNVAGLEPIVGAFLAGLALNRLVPRASPLMNRLTFTGEAIFIPFFLLSVGMLLDARVLFGGLETWAVAIGMTVTVIATKWLAANAARVLFRYRKEEGQVMFGLSIVQAAATLASVMVGHRIGLFDDAVVNGTLLMILVTCVLGPWVVSKYGPALGGSAAATEKPKDTSGILVPIHSAQQAAPAMELALLLRNEDSRTTIYPAFVAAEGGDVARAMAAADEILGPAVAQASAAGCVAEPIKRVDDDPGRALVRVRKELGVRDVVVPWDGAPSDELTADPGANVFLSRLPHPLATSSRVVLVVPSGPTASPGFAGAAQVIGRLCKALGAPLVALCVPKEGATLRESIGRASDGPVEVVACDSPRAWLPLMMAHLRPADLLVLYGAREHEPGFSVEYRELMQRVFSRYPDNDIVVFYPMVASAPSGETPRASTSGRPDD